MSRCIKEGTYTHIHLPVVYGKKEVSGCYWFQRLRVVHDKVNVTVGTSLLLSTSAPVSLATNRCCTVQAFGFVQPYRLQDYKVTYSAAKQWDPGIKKALPWQDGCYVLTFEDLNTCQSSSSSYMLRHEQAIAWGQAMFRRGGSVTPAPIARLGQMLVGHGSYGLGPVVQTSSY
jgi:hypothetical protein